MKTVLTIAGSDSSAGAGIQADLKTLTMLGLYASTCITAITAQNTQGVRSIQDLDPKTIKDQVDMVFEDISPDAVKIGMVSSLETIEVLVDRLNYYKPKNIVLDPLMVSSSGQALLREEARKALIEDLLPLVDLVTPNLAEAQVLSGLSINTRQDMEGAGDLLYRDGGPAFLIKGGHLEEGPYDLLVNKKGRTWFKTEKVYNPNNHGTGCTLSSGIAGGLALGKSMEEAVKFSKAYLTRALKAGLDLGKGPGPLDHAYKVHKA